MLTRRGLITGLVSLAVTAPAIVKAASLMPVKVMEPAVEWPPEVYMFQHRMYFMGRGGVLYEYYHPTIGEWIPPEELYV